MRNEWTSTRTRVLQAIGLYINAHGYGPSVRDIGRLTGITSLGHVEYHIVGLHAEGRITRDRGIARSIRLVAP